MRPQRNAAENIDNTGGIADLVISFNEAAA